MKEMGEGKVQIYAVLVIVTKYKQWQLGFVPQKIKAKTHSSMSEWDTFWVGLRSIVDKYSNKQWSHSCRTHAWLTLGPRGWLLSYPSICVLDGL